MNVVVVTISLVGIVALGIKGYRHGLEQRIDHTRLLLHYDKARAVLPAVPAAVPATVLAVPPAAPPVTLPAVVTEALAALGQLGHSQREAQRLIDSALPRGPYPNVALLLAAVYQKSGNPI